MVSTVARNKVFHPAREPLKTHGSLQLDGDKTNGPLARLNPTRAHFVLVNPGSKEAQSDAQTVPDVYYQWTSRNNRKGRHAIITPASSGAAIDTPSSTSSARSIMRNILRMLTYYPVWDISWLVAVLFTFGSVIWCINGFFAFLPLIRPSSEFGGETLDGGGITAFLGATVFEIGSVLLLLEAVNENRSGCFGWAVKNALEDHELEKGAAHLQLRPSTSICQHHHPDRRNLLSTSHTSLDASSDASKGDAARHKSWTWFPSALDLRTHYIHEIGFLASFVQFWAATIFWIAGFTSLPGIFNNMSVPLTAGVYWTPQVIGGAGFVISGILFMLETQKTWWRPALGTLGWHIGLWNTIGGAGFFLCPVFGYSAASWAQYQAACSTFWGSWAFLIGSVIQWYESMEKYPVHERK